LERVQTHDIHRLASTYYKHAGGKGGSADQDENLMRAMSIILRLWNRYKRTAAFLASAPYRVTLRHVGNNVVLSRGFSVNNPECVSIGDNVFFHEFCWLSMLVQNEQRGSLGIPLAPRLNFGNNSYIGRFTTFACMQEITIGNDVMIADRVFVGDCFHGFMNRELPIKDQYLFSPGPVRIGDGTWIGINASIMPNVTIGRNCVIGANSVVTSDIPDFHVAAGSPARILRMVDDPRGSTPAT
jgi:acetyltransferase-like isoleucine patch superfamily enzyme